MIKGFSGTTLIDFPGKIASIIFIGGCNFRCPICHNPELVLPELLRELKDIDEEYIIKEIERRKGFIDGVVITGGEPLLYDETIELAKRIKENGLLVKLDTNGSFPERLKKIIPFVDYIAMDIKTSLERYNHAAGVSVEIDKIIESIEIIKKFPEHEFRTTIHPDFVTREDIIKICEMIKGSKNYTIQNAKGYKNIDENIRKRLYSDKEFEELKEFVRNILK
uniref:Anaerobic ribonucleoside-triphosphate reductase activating protein n=1 Tax=candidate division WOR-3 bacterium TaxID=2052148 RepID=A0A7C4U8Z3_UNCW3